MRRCRTEGGHHPAARCNGNASALARGSGFDSRRRRHGRHDKKNGTPYEEVMLMCRSPSTSTDIVHFALYERSSFRAESVISSP